MNKIIPISKKARKKLRLARYPALHSTLDGRSEAHFLSLGTPSITNLDKSH
jgi:hypothetical protein